MMKNIKNKSLIEAIKGLETQAAEERKGFENDLKKLESEIEDKALKNLHLKEEEVHVLNAKNSFLMHQNKVLRQRLMLLLQSFKNVNDVAFDEYISAEAKKIAQSQIKEIEEDTATLINTISTKLDDIKMLANRDNFLHKVVETSSAKTQRITTAIEALDKVLEESKPVQIIKNKGLWEKQSQYDVEKKRLGDEVGSSRKEILKNVEEKKSTLPLDTKSLDTTSHNLNKIVSSNHEEIETLKARINTLTKEAEESSEIIQDLKKKQLQYDCNEEQYRDKIHDLEKKIKRMNKKLKQEEEEKVTKEKDEEKKVKDGVQPRRSTPEGESSSTVFTLLPLTESIQKLMVKTEKCCYRYGLDISIYNIIAVAYHYYSVYLYSETTGIDEKLCTCEYDIKCLAWNQQGTLLAIGGGHNENKNNTVQVWDIPNRKIAKRLKIKDSYQNCYCLDWKGDTITAGVNSFIYHWDVNNLDDDRDRQGNKALLPISIFKNKYRSDISSIQWSDCRSKFATITNKGYMCIYNEESKLVYDIKAHSESNYLYLQWCPWDDQVIATSCDKGFLKIWRVHQGITLIKEVMHESGIFNIKWIPSKKTIISAHENNQLLLWEYPSLTIIRTINGHTGIPGCLAINADKSAIVSKSDKEMIFWKPFTEF